MQDVHVETSSGKLERLLDPGACTVRGVGMDEINWTDTEEIGFRLHEAHPEVDPLTLRFTDLRDRVMALPGFVGTADHCGEKILEAIQMAWHEERTESD